MSPRRGSGARAALAVMIVLGAACGTIRLEKKLDPPSREFLSKVRYLITSQERRTFLNLPASERPDFIEEFWRKRDPDPETEENEFKAQYFQRIDEANHLFTDGGEPGWLQDRGRIYILLGPPSDRQVYPRGMTFYGIPVEIWYYGFFQIVFVDPSWTGNFKLDPDSPHQLAEIMKTQLAWKPQVEGEKDDNRLSFGFDVARKSAEEFEVRVRVPYPKIWMSLKDTELRTVLTVTLIGEDGKGGKVQEASSDHALALTEEKLAALRDQAYVITLGFVPQPRTSVLVVTLTNKADKSTVSKRKPLGR